MSRHEKLLAADQDVRLAKDEVHRLDGVRAELVNTLVNEVLEASYRSYELDHDARWRCPEDMLDDGEIPKGALSPTGNCVFHPKTDPGRLRCLFCKGPQDRQ